MPRRSIHGEAARAGAADSLPGLLGLYHADHSPVTLTDCQAQAEEARAEKSQYAEALRVALKAGQDSDPFERAALVEGMWFCHLRLLAWKALERLARFAVEVRP